MTRRRENLVIVGAGPAGLTAAIYTARAGLDPLVIEKLQPGGMMATTDIIENYPGFDEGISGPDLAMKMHRQAEKFGARFAFGEVHQLLPEAERKILRTDLGEFEVNALIAAGGTEHRLLGIPGEREFFGRGVSVCGTCDGPFYRGKAAGVVGGGNSAIQEAMFIARFAQTVHLIHRRDQLRADKILADRAMALPNLNIIWDTIVTAVLGDASGVTGLTLQNKKTGEQRNLAVDGFFEFIGLIPNNQWLKDLPLLNEEGFIKADKYGRTDLPGLFVAGDLKAKETRQIATAVGDGALVARLVEDYLDSQA